MQKSVPISVSFVAALGVFLIACLASSVLPKAPAVAPKTEIEQGSQPELVTELPFEPPWESLPQSKMDWDLVSRLAEGIRQFHSRNDDLYWYECGKRYTKKQADRAAFEWARTVVHACALVSDDDIKLNPWMVAGTIANESRFDRCSLGPGPREQAEKLGFIKPSRRTLSRNRAQIERYLSSRTWRNLPQNGVDIGGLQVLSGYISLTPDRMMTLDPGLYAQVRHMRQRSEWCRHKDRPWGCWPGRYTAWYDHRIKMRALDLGAPPHKL